MSNTSGASFTKHSPRFLGVRPNVHVIHLVAAAPVSATFAVGPELNLRYCLPIRTYRFRRETGDTEAIRITASSAATSSIDPTANDLKIDKRVPMELDA